MCRLYGFYATEPTKVECTLVHAQNALIAQSLSDLSGYDHAHGWGVATFDEDGGAYDQADAGGFIKLNALRLKLLAARDRRLKG